MSARPIGSATIAFGLVSVPIKLYSAGESSAAVTFNWLHKKDGSRLKQQYVCAQDGEKVEKDDMVKGYEFAKGQYVTFTPEELKALDEKSTGAIDIGEFVPAHLVDRLWLERAYFVGPDKGGERAFKLLAAALKESKRAALGQYASRGKQYLVMIRPLEGGLVMEQLHYADEIRTIADVDIPEGEVKKAELALAMQLIEQGATDKFEPEKYEDTVKKRVLESIQLKVEGHEITSEPAAAPETQIIDLMEALKQSLAKAGGGKADEAEERKPAKRAPRLKLEKADEAPKKKRKAS
jgi:DNA end-binding protein Ku